MTTYAYSVPLGQGRYIVPLKCLYCGYSMGTAETMGTDDYKPSYTSGVCGGCKPKHEEAMQAARRKK